MLESLYPNTSFLPDAPCTLVVHHESAENMTCREAYRRTRDLEGIRRIMTAVLLPLDDGATLSLCATSFRDEYKRQREARIEAMYEDELREAYERLQARRTAEIAATLQQAYYA